MVDAAGSLVWAVAKALDDAQAALAAIHAEAGLAELELWDYGSGGGVAP